MKTIKYELADGIATITFDEPDSPVNTMCRQWQDDLSALAARVALDQERITGRILASAKKTFFAGAELKDVLKLTEADYAWVTRELMALAHKHSSSRLISTLEGGYALSALGRSVTEHIREILAA